jgi:uncharacterized membrane protein YfcA
MIQRIQTIWLLLASMAFLAEWYPSVPMVKTLSPGEGLLADQVLYASESMPLLIGSGVSGILALIAVFLYKERTMQIVIAASSSLVQILLTIGSSILILYKYNKMNDFSPQLGFMFALAGIIFVWLATRGIRKDQQIVRSMDRLR